MATKKISELEAITEADGSDVLAIVDVSEGKTNKITKNNLLKGSGHTIEMSLNENYQIVLKLKNAEGTELSTATIDLPNENAITNISYSNGTLTLTKQSGVTSTVDISGLINGLATETALTNLANALKETIGIDTTTYNESQTYNTGDIVVQNEKIYKANQDNITGTFDSSKWDEISLYEYQKIQDEAIAENYKVITKLQEDVEDLTERVEDAENNEITNTPTPSTSHYLQDSADSRFRRFIPIGRTTQESTTGKNLANVPENWSFTRYVAIPIDLEAGDYIISIKSGTNNGTTNTNIFIADDNNNRLGSFGFPKNSGEKNANITINSKATKLMCYSQYDYTLGENITATINQFMIRKASVTDDTYEPYTGGEPAPNPIYPYAIKNTGDNVNEFNKDDVTKILDMYVNSSNNLISSNSNAKSFYIECEKNKQYTISRKAGQRFVVGTTTTIPTSGMTVNNKVYDLTADKLTIQTGSNDNYIICFYYLSSADTLTEEEIRNSIKVEQGTVATPYSPYGCGNVNEKVQNKNVIIGTKNNIGIYADNGQILEISGRYCQYCKVTAGEQYTISRKSVGTSSYFYYGFYGEELKEGIKPVNRNFGNMGNDTLKFTTPIAPNGAKYLVVFYGIGLSEEPMIEQSSTPTSYVPHSEQDISFPLSQGQKFYEGSHPDDDEKVHHVRGEVVLDGTETVTKGTSTLSQYNYFLVDKVLSLVPKYMSDFSNSILCTHFKGMRTEANLYVDNGICISSNLNRFVITDNSITTASDFKAYLAEQYTNGTPVKVVYELAEEQTEDFTSEQQTAWKEWKKARTYKNITHISSEDETPANVEIEYVVDINTIDDRITALEAKVDLLEE